MTVNCASEMCITIGTCCDGMRGVPMAAVCGVSMMHAIVVLYGRSFEFGAPLFGNLKYVNWDSMDGKERPLFHQPHWPYDETLLPVALLY